MSEIQILHDSLVLIPTYNEKENIENIIRAVFNLPEMFDRNRIIHLVFQK